MNKIYEFFQEGYGWLHTLLASLLVLVSGLICIQISGPDTAIYSGLGVLICAMFGVSVYTAVGLSKPNEAVHGCIAEAIGGLIGVLALLFFC